jgi:transposase
MSKRQPKTNYWQDAPQPREQIVLFADTLEQRIPEDHPVRILDEILSRMDWSKWEAEYHGKFGQPPIHPSVMCKALLFGMIRRIRSSRQIEYNLRHSIDFMWLVCGRTIDHATLSEFRRKHPQQLKDLYRQMVQLGAALAQLREMDQQRKRDGINPKKNPAQLPVTDPDSRVLPNKEGGYAPNYTPMAVTETENGFIVGADVLIGNVEHLVMTTMIDTIELDFGETPESDP